MNEDNTNIKMPPRSVSEPQKFIRDIMWIAISQVFTSLLGIITLPALTKSYSSATFGVWAQVSATYGLVSPLLSLHLGTAAVRYLAGEEDKTKRRQSLGSMLSAIIIFACFALIATLILAEPLSLFLFDDPGYTSFVILTFLWTFVGALFAFLISYLRARGKIKRLAIIQTALPVAKMVFIIVLATAGFGLEWIIACMVATEVLLTLLVFYMIVRDTGFPMPNFTGLRTFLAFSIPQIPSGILLWIISASDRYFITHLLNLSQTGIYSSSRALGGLISLFFAPISFVLFPVVSKTWEQKRPADVKSYLEYSTKLFLTLALPAAAGLAVLSQSILKILATSEYLAGGELVLLVAIGTIFMGIYQMNAYIVLLVQQTKWLPLMIVAAAATSAGVNSVLIPRIGILGAAISNIASYFVLATIVTLWARRAVAYSIDLKYFGKVIAAALVMALGLWYLPVNGVFGITMAMAAGVAIFGSILFLLRAFSEQDKRLFRETLAGINPLSWKRSDLRK